MCMGCYTIYYFYEMHMSLGYGAELPSFYTINRNRVIIMKKILFLIPTLAHGGAEKVLVNLANNLDQEKV